MEPFSCSPCHSMLLLHAECAACGAPPDALVQSRAMARTSTALSPRGAIDERRCLKGALPRAAAARRHNLPEYIPFVGFHRRDAWRGSAYASGSRRASIQESYIHRRSYCPQAGYARRTGDIITEGPSYPFTNAPRLLGAPSPWSPSIAAYGEARYSGPATWQITPASLARRASTPFFKRLLPPVHIASPSSLPSRRRRLFRHVSPPPSSGVFQKHSHGEPML